jgi:hypothetical protein
MAARRLSRPLYNKLGHRTFGRLPSWLTYLVGGMAALSVAIVMALIAAVGVGIVTGTFDQLFGTLPRVETVVEQEPFRTANILDRQGQLLYEVFDPQGGKRTIVPLQEIPSSLINATIATEDPRFYDNPGFRRHRHRPGVLPEPARTGHRLGRVDDHPAAGPELAVQRSGALRDKLRPEDQGSHPGIRAFATLL